MQVGVSCEFRSIGVVSSGHSKIKNCFGDVFPQSRIQDKGLRGVIWNDLEILSFQIVIPQVMK